MILLALSHQPWDFLWVVGQQLPGRPGMKRHYILWNGNGAPRIVSPRHAFKQKHDNLNICTTELASKDPSEPPAGPNIILQSDADYQTEAIAE